VVGIESRQLMSGCDIVVSHLKTQIIAGKNWFVSLLEAIGMCDVSEELHNGRLYRYLIAGEALDWLVMAERLLSEVDSGVPEDEKSALLFQGKTPFELPADEFKKRLGAKKYRQYLNYFYGVVVEEALIQRVREELRKERIAHGYRTDLENDDEIYARIYGDTRSNLLRHFRKEKGYPSSRVTSLTELKEFTYWLFKYRVRQSEPARIASDTKKGLAQLRTRGFPGRPAESRRRQVVSSER